jgi:hypothetical protein
MKKRHRKKIFKRIKAMLADAQATLCFKWVMFDFNESGHTLVSIQECKSARDCNSLR